MSGVPSLGAPPDAVGSPPQSQTDPYKSWLDRGATPGQALAMTGQSPPQPESLGGPTPTPQLYDVLPGKEKEFEDAKAKIKRHVQQKYGKVLSDDEAGQIARGGDLKTTLSIPTLQNLDQQTRLALLASEQTGVYNPPGGGPPVKTMTREKQEYEQGTQAGYATLPSVTAAMLGVTEITVPANAAVPPEVVKRIGERFKAIIGIEATPDQIHTLARGGELRNILVPSTEARRLAQGEAALTGELGGKLTLVGKAFNAQEESRKLDDAIKRASVTGDFIDPVTKKSQKTLESQRFQLQEAGVTGLYQGEPILQLRLAKMDDQRQRDFVLGYDDVTRRDKNGNPVHVYGTNELPLISQKRGQDWEAMQLAGFDYTNPDTGVTTHVMGRDELASDAFKKSEMVRGGYWKVEYGPDGKTPLKDPATGRPIITHVMGTTELGKYQIDTQAELDRANLKERTDEWADSHGLDHERFNEAVRQYDQGQRLKDAEFREQVFQFRRTYSLDQQRVDNQNNQFYAEQERLEKQYAGYDVAVKDKDGRPTFDEKGNPITRHIFGQSEMQLSQQKFEREMANGYDKVDPNDPNKTVHVFGTNEWTRMSDSQRLQQAGLMSGDGGDMVIQVTNKDGTTGYQTVHITGANELANNAWYRTQKETYGYFDPNTLDPVSHLPVWRPGTDSRQITLLQTQADISDTLASHAAIRQNAHDLLMANVNWNATEKTQAWESAEKILDRANGERMAELLGQREMSQQDREDARARAAAGDARDALFITTASSVIGSAGNALLTWALRHDVPSDDWSTSLGNVAWLKKNIPGLTDDQYNEMAARYTSAGAGHNEVINTGGGLAGANERGTVAEQGGAAPGATGGTGAETPGAATRLRSGDQPITPGTIFSASLMGLAGLGKGLSGTTMSGSASFATDVVALLPVALGMMNPIAGVAYLAGQGFGSWLSADKSNQAKRQIALREGLWTTQPTQGMLTGIEDKLPQGSGERGKVRVRFDFDTDFDPNTAAPGAVPQLKVTFYSPAAGTFYEESYEQFVQRTKIMPLSFVGAEDNLYNRLPDPIKKKFKDAGFKPSYALIFDDGWVTLLSRPGKNGLQKSVSLNADEAKPLFETGGGIAADQNKPSDAVNARGVNQLDQVRADAIKGSSAKAGDLDAVANGLGSDAQRLRFWSVVSKAEAFTNADIDYIFGRGMAQAQSTAYNRFLGLVSVGKLQWDRKS